MRCCSPSASKRREYVSSSLSSCTGNEMWNEMSRYNRRATSLVHLLFKTDQRRDRWSGSSPQAGWLVFYHVNINHVGEKNVCWFTVFFILDCTDDIHLVLLSYLCFVLMLSGLFMHVSYSVFQFFYFQNFFWNTGWPNFICLSSFSSWSCVNSPPCPKFVPLYSSHKPFSPAVLHTFSSLTLHCIFLTVSSSAISS